MEQYTGGCLCGDVRFTVTGPPNRVGVCHCLDCRKHHGSVFQTFAAYPRGAFTSEGETRAYEGRSFCPRCGSPVFSVGDEEVEVHAGSLDAANQWKPIYELWTVRRESWVPPVPGAAQYERDRT